MDGEQHNGRRLKPHGELPAQLTEELLLPEVEGHVCLAGIQTEPLQRNNLLREGLLIGIEYPQHQPFTEWLLHLQGEDLRFVALEEVNGPRRLAKGREDLLENLDRKSTRLNSSHL